MNVWKISAYEYTRINIVRPVARKLPQINYFGANYFPQKSMYAIVIATKYVYGKGVNLS